MKKVIVLMSVFLSLLSCKTIPENDNGKNGTSQTQKGGLTEHDIESIFELTGFEFSLNPVESVKNTDGIYDVRYDFKFSILTNKSVTVSYKIYDLESDLLYEKESIKSGGISQDKKEYFIEDALLLYQLDVEINRKSYMFTGEFENPSVPSLTEMTAGPLITRIENRKNNVSLYINLRISNCNGLEWIRLIPPSLDYFWTLQYKTEDLDITSNTLINDSKHANYIDNGNYIIQINLGNLGIIQKEINITDYLNNKSGPNYGLPVAEEKNSNKNEINISFGQPDRIDYYEIWLFADTNKNSRKIGTAKYAVPDETIQKKELFELFFDDRDNRVKLKYNKKYYYRISLYSKEINGLKYISISDLIPLTFQGFSLFNF